MLRLGASKIVQVDFLPRELVSYCKDTQTPLTAHLSDGEAAYLPACLSVCLWHVCLSVCVCLCACLCACLSVACVCVCVQVCGVQSSQTWSSCPPALDRKSVV